MFSLAETLEETLRANLKVGGFRDYKGRYLTNVGKSHMHRPLVESDSGLPTMFSIPWIVLITDKP